VQDSTVPLIAMEYAFGGGATQDPADKPGVGNMAANLLDEGSGDLDSKTFHERLERRAIELSFSSARDNFRGSLRMLRDNRDEAFDLLRMALTSPRFESSDVERIRAQVMSGLRRETSNPNSLASRKLLETAFGNHPYGRPGNGTLESVPRIDVADLKDYVRRVLARDTLRIAVVGDVDPARSASCSTRPSADCRPKPAWRRSPTSRPPSRRSAPSFRSTCRRPW
jgi:Predicted Zn-dependent peptidases